MKGIKAYPRRYFLGLLILLILVVLVETALLMVGPERVLNGLRRELRITDSDRNYEVPVEIVVSDPITSSDRNYEVPVAIVVSDPITSSDRNYEVPVAIVVSDPITSDPLSKYQWGLRMMLDGMSYQEVQGDAPRDVIVAVIDSGVHMNHPDLLKKSVDGWNFIDNSAELREQYDGNVPAASIAHGQCSASIIAAETNNGIGMAGVFARAYIMPLQTDLNHMADAIEFAVGHDADVILIAGGGGEILWPMYGTNDLRPRESLYTSDNLRVIGDIKEALGNAYDANIPVVTGVGNTGQFAVTLLAEDYRTIAVAPHNILGEVSVDTSFSYAFEVFAPGGSWKAMTNVNEISVEFPQDLIVFHPYADYDDPICAIGLEEYSFLTLGSAAMPHVAGAIAMIKSYLPDATVEDVREILRQGQVPLTPSGSVLEALAGRISLRRIKAEIEQRLADWEGLCSQGSRRPRHRWHSPGKASEQRLEQ